MYAFKHLRGLLKRVIDANNTINSTQFTYYHNEITCARAVSITVSNVDRSFFCRLNSSLPTLSWKRSSSNTGNFKAVDLLALLLEPAAAAVLLVVGVSYLLKKESKSSQRLQNN